jgi:hypothetical protein
MKAVRSVCCPLVLAVGIESQLFAQPAFDEVHSWTINSRDGTFGYADLVKADSDYHVRRLYLGPLGVAVDSRNIAAGAAALWMGVAGLAILSRLWRNTRCNRLSE